jgi:hypothetical protein
MHVTVTLPLAFTSVKLVKGLRQLESVSEHGAEENI